LGKILPVCIIVIREVLNQKSRSLDNIIISLLVFSLIVQLHFVVTKTKLV
jgi:hypothetical protein